MTAGECSYVLFFFQAEDGIRDLVRSRGLGDVYKRQSRLFAFTIEWSIHGDQEHHRCFPFQEIKSFVISACLLYTSDAADERSSVDLGGRRIIKKKKKASISTSSRMKTQKH